MVLSLRWPPVSRAPRHPRPQRVKNCKCLNLNGAPRKTPTCDPLAPVHTGCLSCWFFGGLPHHGTGGLPGVRQHIITAGSIPWRASRHMSREELHAVKNHDERHERVTMAAPTRLANPLSRRTPVGADRHGSRRPTHPAWDARVRRDPLSSTGHRPRPETARQNLRFAADAHPTLSTVLESVHQIELLSEDKASERHVVMTDTPSSLDVLQAYLLARATFSAEELAFMRTVPAADAGRRGRSCSAPATLRSMRRSSRAAACAASSSMARAKSTSCSSRREQWWLADAISLNTRTPSRYFFAAIEQSDVLLIDAPGQQQIVDRVPGYSEAMRAGLQKQPPPRTCGSSSRSVLRRRNAISISCRRSRPWRSACRSGCWPHTSACRRRPSAASANSCRGSSSTVAFRATTISRGEVCAS